MTLTLRGRKRVFPKVTKNRNRERNNNNNELISPPKKKQKFPPCKHRLSLSITKTPFQFSFEKTMPSSTSNPIRDFFPVISSSSNPPISQFISFIFPDSPQSQHTTTDLKSPAIAIAAGIGCYIGFVAGKRLFRLSRTDAAFRGSFSWAMALLWYSLMCFGGFWYHSFELGHMGHFFYTLDVLGTACSAIAIVAGALGIEDRNPAKRRGLVLLFGLAAMVTALGSRLVAEIIYLFPVTVAFPAGVWFVWARVIKKKTRAGEDDEGDKERGNKKKNRGLKKWGAISAFGAAFSLIGLVTNRRISAVFGADLGAIFWFFLGCNIAIFGLGKIVTIDNNANNLLDLLF